MASTVTTTATVARVNLLPPEIAERARVRRVQAGLGAAVGVSVLVVGALYFLQVAKVNDAQEDLDLAKREGVVLAQRRAELQSVADTYAAVAAKEAVLRAALAQDISWSSYLNDLMLTIPDNVWLTSVAVSQSLGAAAPAPVPSGPLSIGTVTFSGMAFDHDDVATWLEVLSRQRGYGNPYFTSSVEQDLGSRKLYPFSSSVTLTEEALSGRVARLLGD